MNYTKSFNFSEIRVSFYITEKRYSIVINHCTRTANKSVIVSVKSYASAVDFQNINSVFGKRIIDCAVGGYGTVFTDNRS